MKRIVLAALTLALLAVTARSTTPIHDNRGIWQRYQEDVALYLARCGAADADGRATCEVIQAFKGESRSTLIVHIRPWARAATTADMPSIRLIRTHRWDKLPEVGVGFEFDYLLVPDASVDLLKEYIATWSWLTAMSDPTQRNVAYWKAVLAWQAVDDPFMHEVVTRDLPGGSSPWGGRIPDLSDATEVALSSRDPIVRLRFRIIITHATRDDPTDEAQAQVVRLLEHDPSFARRFLDHYASRPFRRDEVIMSALRRIETAPSGKDPVVVERARRVLRERGQ